MFFPGTPNILVLGDSVFMLLKCMRNNTTIEKKNLLILESPDLNRDKETFTKR